MFVRLHRHQAKKVDTHGEPAFRITVRITAPSAVKTAQGAMKAVGYKPTEGTIWWRRKLGYLVCGYEDIEKYLECAKKLM